MTPVPRVGVIAFGHSGEAELGADLRAARAVTGSPVTSSRRLAIEAVRDLLGRVLRAGRAEHGDPHRKAE